jgi:hypothetical protein
MCTACEKPLAEADLSARIALALAADVQEIGLWSLPIPDYWWPYLSVFARTPLTGGTAGHV